ncbi:MAG: hypothetical protein ABI206_13270 [Antricoccus sp.]
MARVKRTKTGETIRYIAVLAAVVMFLGGRFSSVGWLLWVGLALLIITLVLLIRDYFTQSEPSAS